jgi:hypothetical protein
MGVVRREGKWRLSKVADGFYRILERDKVAAEIITDDYQNSGGMLGGGETPDPMTETIEVRNFDQAEDMFNEYANGERGGDILGI